jgi:hypothetical protein
MKNENQFRFGADEAESQNSNSRIFIKLGDGNCHDHVVDMHPGKQGVSAQRTGVTAIVTNINISNTSNVTNIYIGSNNREKPNEKDAGAGDFWRSRI